MFARNGLPVIQAQSREGAANRLRRTSLLRVADFTAKRFQTIPMDPPPTFMLGVYRVRP